MTKETINSREATNLEELRDALNVLGDDADQHPSAVYIRCKGEPVHLELVEETLSDGSKVYNIHIRGY